MRTSNSRSRSRGRRGQRKSQERNFPKRSQSRSGSRGRRGGGDSNKRRSKFSDPSNLGGMGSTSRGFSRGFQEPQDPYRGGGGFDSKPQGGFQQRLGEGQFQMNPSSQGGNGGNFAYNNVRQNDYDDFDIEKAIQIQKQDQLGQPGMPGLRTKISRKVYIPQDGKFNYIGLIIGPKGSNQKQLEEQTHCKILIRGKGSQKVGAPLMGDENEDLHVLIEADNEMNATNAMKEIENIIFMEDEEKSKKRDSQLRSAQIGGGKFNEFNSNDNSSFIQVPNNCVGLVIGRKGETIKQIRERSGAERVYMQSEAQRNLEAEYQNLVVEGTQDAVEKVQGIIEEIKAQQRKKYGGNPNECRISIDVPPNMAGLVIGKQGSTLQQVGQQTRTRCQIQQDMSGQDPRKTLIITGQSEEDCRIARDIFLEKIDLRNSAMNRTFMQPDLRSGPGGYGARRPRKNAEGDEIVDDANMYEYPYPQYQDPMMHNPQMYPGMGYPPQFAGFGVPPPPLKDGSQYPPQDLAAQQPYPNKQEEHLNHIEGSIQNAEGSGQPQGYGQQYDPMQLQQMQLQMQYQQYYYQQMLMQNSGPVIEEVLPDGTVISTNTAQEEDDKKKGKRGGRR